MKPEKFLTMVVKAIPMADIVVPNINKKVDGILSERYPVGS
jgi:hypothetical protein